MLSATGMTTTEREALAQRLGLAERELQQAQHGLDGSLQARTRLELARAAYRAAEHLTLRVLGARQALDLVEELESSTSGCLTSSETPAPATRSGTRRRSSGSRPETR